MVVESSHILNYKQEVGSSLDLCKKVVQYCNLFDDVHVVHETWIGNNHPKSKAKTLYKRVTTKYVKSIPQ